MQYNDIVQTLTHIGGNPMKGPFKILALLALMLSMLFSCTHTTHN